MAAAMQCNKGKPVQPALPGTAAAVGQRLSAAVLTPTSQLHPSPPASTPTHSPSCCLTTHTHRPALPTSCCPPPVTSHCPQLGRVRVRQHVNPLASKFQRPTPTVDWAQIYQDPTRPLFVVGDGWVTGRDWQPAAAANLALSRAEEAGQATLRRRLGQ